MKKVAVLCRDELLFQKIRLALLDLAECKMIEDGKSAKDFDICFVDADLFDAPKNVNTVLMSHGGNGDLQIPFLISAPKEYLLEKKSKAAALLISDDERTVRIRSKTVKLTELEFELLKLLLSESRHFSKEEILRAVWGEGVDIGIVNVYVHYLREKLEADGEKIIISARNKGYKIDKRFLKGEDGNA